jgi:hypothetical protein
VMIRLLSLVLNPNRVHRVSHPKPRRTSMSKVGGVRQCAPACIQPGETAASVHDQALATRHYYSMGPPRAFLRLLET